jgi:hypothetical protein
MDKRTRTWISVIVGVLIVIVMLGVAAIGGAFYFITSHIRQTSLAEVQAGDRFEGMRQRLSGRQPLLSLDDRDEVVIHRTESPSTARLTTLRAMVYDAQEERIVEVDIPFWLLRMMPSGGRFSFLNDNGINFSSERTRLTVEDLERHGAGLVLDHRDRRGAQVLVWTE